MMRTPLTHHPMRLYEDEVARKLARASESQQPRPKTARRRFVGVVLIAMLAYALIHAAL